MRVFPVGIGFTGPLLAWLKSYSSLILSCPFVGPPSHAVSPLGRGSFESCFRARCRPPRAPARSRSSPYVTKRGSSAESSSAVKLNSSLKTVTASAKSIFTVLQSDSRQPSRDPIDKPSVMYVICALSRDSTSKECEPPATDRSNSRQVNFSKNENESYLFKRPSPPRGQVPCKTRSWIGSEREREEEEKWSSNKEGRRLLVTRASGYHRRPIWSPGCWIWALACAAWCATRPGWWDGPDRSGSKSSPATCCAPRAWNLPWKRWTPPTTWCIASAGGADFSAARSVTAASQLRRRRPEPQVSQRILYLGGLGDAANGSFPSACVPGSRPARRCGPSGVPVTEFRAGGDRRLGEPVCSK